MDRMFSFCMLEWRNLTQWCVTLVNPSLMGGGAGVNGLILAGSSLPLSGEGPVGGTVAKLVEG